MIFAKSKIDLILASSNLLYQIKSEVRYILGLILASFMSSKHNKNLPHSESPTEALDKKVKFDQVKWRSCRHNQVRKQDNDRATQVGVLYWSKWLVWQQNYSRVLTWISKPFPIQFTLIRMTFHGMDRYFKPELRLPFWQPFDLA